MNLDNLQESYFVPERYRLLEPKPIGGGAMGVVFKAWDTKLDRTVALKLLQQSSTTSNELAPKPDIARAIQEARALAKVSHPGVLQVFDVIEENDNCWIVTEWLDGRTLDKLSLPLHPVSVAAILSQMMSALDAVHGTGIVHRDLKPSNVALCTSGRVVLLDFGVAFLPGGSSGATIAGTLRYCDASRLEGLAPTQTSDIFSAALVGLELLSAFVVIPDLAPLPLHRFLTRSLAQRLRECGEGFYPPLVSIFESMALSPSATSNKTHTAAWYASSFLNLFHHFTNASTELFLQYHEVENRPVADNVNQKIQDEISDALKNSAIAPRTKAAWMAFLKTAGTRFSRRSAASGRKMSQSVLFVALLFMSAVGAGAIVFVKRSAISNAGQQSSEVPVVAARTTEVPVVAARTTEEPVVAVETTAKVELTPKPVLFKTAAPVVKSIPPTQYTPVQTPRVVSVSVYFSSNAWAVLYIDGKKEGQLPMAEPLSLSPGRHRIRLENPMTENFEGVLDVPSSTQPIKHHFRLTPREQN